MSISRVNSESKEKVILGIDPGTSVMGYGVIAVKGQSVRLLQFGVIRLAKYPNHAVKLKKIFERVTSLIDDHLPDEMALEAPFHGKNVQSMLKLGRAQGVAMAAALQREIPVVEYAPKKVKVAVTGNGNASKEQVAGMLRSQFKFKEEEIMLDATDALAVALCHHYQRNAPNSAGKSWASFAKENPGKILG